MTSPPDFLREYLVHAPAALALLRAIECRELSALQFDRPILDLGCGDGLFGRIFFGKHKAVDVGFDYSMRELRTSVSRDDTAAPSPYQDYVCGDIGKLPFADSSFATVFSNGVLEHVEDLPAGLAEIARVLRPEGRLICTVPTMASELELSGAAALRSLGLESLAQSYATLYNRVFGQINVCGWPSWHALLLRSNLEPMHHETYGSQSVFRLHDLTLPLSVPSYLFKRLTGCWTKPGWLRRHVMAPLWTRLLHPLYAGDELERSRQRGGCSLLMIARPVRPPSPGG